MLSTTRAQGCWLRMWCRSSPEPPAPTSSPSPNARLCHAQPPPPAPPQLPGSKCPPEQPAAPTHGRGGAACLWLGHCWGFGLLCELAHSQVGWGQENELVQGEQPNPWPSPAASQQRERREDGRPAQPAPRTWQRAQLFHGVARHILHRGVLLLILLLTAPGAVCLAAGSTFIS